MNKEYQRINNDLLNFDPNNIREIILNGYDPSLFPQNKYTRHADSS